VPEPRTGAPALTTADIAAKIRILRCIAREAVRRAQGRPSRLLVFTPVITAIVGAFLSVSAVVDNLADATTLVTLVEDLGGAIDMGPLIGALALGANLGGTATVFSASAIVVLASLSQASGSPITLVRRVRSRLPRAVARVFVGEAHIWLRYQVLLS